MIRIFSALKTAASAVLAYVVHVLGYIKDRLCEGSTWAALSAGGLAASPLPAPWSYVVLTGFVMAAMAPNRVKAS